MTSIDSSNPILIEVYQNLETAVHLLNRHPLVSRIAIDKNMISILFTGSREEEAQLLRQLVEQKVLVTSFRREHNNLGICLFSYLTGSGTGRNSSMRKNPVLENEMKRYTRNMKCAWIFLA